MIRGNEDALEAFLGGSEKRPEPETIDWDVRYADRSPPYQRAPTVLANRGRSHRPLDSGRRRTRRRRSQSTLRSVESSLRQVETNSVQRSLLSGPLSTRCTVCFGAREARQCAVQDRRPFRISSLTSKRSLRASMTDHALRWCRERHLKSLRAAR